MEELAVLPVFWKLQGRRVLLAGAGEGGAWKAELLAAAGADVDIIAEELSHEMKALLEREAAAGSLTHHARTWAADDFDGAALALLDTESDHDEPGRDWKIDDFLDLAGMSRSQFMSEFQSIVGKTPIAYLKQWRMVLARVALIRGDRVKEVARKFGYSSGDAFCRAFVGVYGIAPTKLVYDQLQSA